MGNSRSIEIIDQIRWLASSPRRVKIAVGGRGSGKSTGIADYMLTCIAGGETVLAAREYQNSIDDSVHETVRREIDRLRLPGFTVNATEIRHRSGGRMFYKGLARNITSLKSLAGIDKLWIEEGESISKLSLSVLSPSVRSAAGSNKMPEIWITMNRRSRQDAIALKYLSRAESQLEIRGYYEDDLMRAVQVNYTDNPWFPAELELERLDDKARLTLDEYEHIWGGRYNESIEAAIIKKEWFDTAIDAHIKLGIEPSGAVITAFDPADGGRDPCGYASRHGILYTDIAELVVDDGNKACRLAMDRAIKARTDLFVWDGDGMGALLREQINNYMGASKSMECREYRGSGAVEDKKTTYNGLQSLSTKDRPKTNADMFYNKRAQYYMKLAQRFYNTYQAVVEHKYINPDSLISLSSSLPVINKLRSELCRIPRIDNPSGKIQLMSKKDMLKQGISSPNMADCLAMAEELPYTSQQRVKAIEFEDWY